MITAALLNCQLQANNGAILFVISGMLQKATYDLLLPHIHTVFVVHFLSHYIYFCL